MKHLVVWGKIVLSLIMVIVFMLMVGVLIAVVGLAAGVGNSDVMEWAEKLSFTQYIQMALFIGVPLLLYVLFERKRGWSIGIKQRGAAWLGVQGAMYGIILVTGSAVLIRALGGIEWQVAEWNGELAGSLATGFVLFICVAISEEFYSRGYVQGVLKDVYGPRWAIVLSATLFALMHSLNSGMFDSPFPIMNLILAGVVLALAREWTGGLWWSIGLHLTWNFFQGNIYGFHVSGNDSQNSLLSAADKGPAWLSGGTFGIEGSLISVLVLLVGAVGLYLLYGKKQVSVAGSTSL